MEEMLKYVANNVGTVESVSKMYYGDDIIPFSDNYIDFLLECRV